MMNGRILNERYKLLRPVGGGGMAKVYLARDIILHRDVAIKILRMEYSNDQEFIERFRREAESAISLSNNHIVNIYDVGQEEDVYYIVMEYVEGMTLKQHIQQFGPASVEEAVNITSQLASAISHAHENGIIHRDIKPQNILIDQYGNVKVTDFGIAMALSSTSLTRTNSVIGSVHYLSPEQARGGTATKKSDIYSLGIVLYELLTGQLPFSGESAVSIALKHMQTETPYVRTFNPSIPQSLENVVLKATAKDPFHRYQSIEEMFDDLQTVLDPSRADEERFVAPVEEGEVTKAMPIFTDKNITDTSDQNTLIHTNGEPKTNEKKYKKWIIFLVSFLTLIITAAVIALFAMPKFFSPNDVEIPDLVNYTYEDAVTELADLKLEVSRESVTSDEIEEGRIVRTNPKKGTVVKEGSQVVLYTSLGKEKTEFPDYVGQQYDQVERYLINNGYLDVIPYEKVSDLPKGEIIRQIQPEPGDKVIPEDTKVIFDVSAGPPKVILQSLRGWTVEEVQDYIKQNNLNLRTEEEFSDEVPEGHVIRQEPSASTELEKGDEVRIYVSKGPDLQPINVTETVTVEYEAEILHEVVIYVTDMNRDQVEYVRQPIFEDKTFEINLTIAPNQMAKIEVYRDGELYDEKTIPYERPRKDH
ncbi:Stk1 family PASTA domain-containing Ser/Thr kinase [Bacillaceae bacterium W0354]